MKSLAGAWLNSVAAHELTIEMSSTMPAVCGNSSDTHAPLCPCRANLRRVPSNLVPWLLSMNANRLPAIRDSGTGCPFSSINRGL